MCLSISLWVLEGEWDESMSLMLPCCQGQKQYPQKSGSVWSPSQTTREMREDDEILAHSTTQLQLEIVVNAIPNKFIVLLCFTRHRQFADTRAWGHSADDWYPHLHCFRPPIFSDSIPPCPIGRPLGGNISIYFIMIIS